MTNLEKQRRAEEITIEEYKEVAKQSLKTKMEETSIAVLVKPKIQYLEAIEYASQDVIAKIEALNIDEIEATEANLKEVKDTKANLKKDFEEFENQRKLVKDMVLKPYNDFETLYKDKIATVFKDAEAKLKTLVNSVESGILNKKIDGIKSYFDEVNTYDFIKFEYLNLKIIKSVTDKKLKEEIEAYLLAVQSDLSTIETLPNKERVLAKYQMNRDLNLSISQTNIEIQREEAIKKQQEEANRRAEEQNKVKTAPVVIQAEPAVLVPEIKEVEQQEILSTTFKAFGTIEQLKKLKQFMNEEGIRYEQPNN